MAWSPVPRSPAAALARAAALAGALTSALLVLAPAGFASQQHPTLVEMESEVICPTCHTTLDQSDSLEARRIERFIAGRIAAGDSKGEIKAKLVAQFGEAILAAPPRRGFDLLAWWLPIAGVLAGAAVVGVSAWRWSRRGGRLAEATEPISAIPAELERRIDEELARF